MNITQIDERYNQIEDLITAYSDLYESLQFISTRLLYISESKVNLSLSGTCLNTVETALNILKDEQTSLLENRFISIINYHDFFHVFSGSEYGEIIAELTNQTSIFESNNLEISKRSILREINSLLDIIQIGRDRLENILKCLKETATYLELLKLEPKIVDFLETLETLKSGKEERKKLIDKILTLKRFKNLNYLPIFGDNNDKLFLFSNSDFIVKNLDPFSSLSNGDVYLVRSYASSLDKRIKSYKDDLDQQFRVINSNFKEFIDDEDKLYEDFIILDPINSTIEDISACAENRVTMASNDEIKNIDSVNEIINDLKNINDYLRSQKEMLNTDLKNKYNSQLILSNTNVVIVTSYEALLNIIKSKFNNFYESSVRDKIIEIDNILNPLLMGKLDKETVRDLNLLISFFSYLQLKIIESNKIDNLNVKLELSKLLNRLTELSLMINNKIIENLN